jgi:hypothetical protein
VDSALIPGVTLIEGVTYGDIGVSVTVEVGVAGVDSGSRSSTYPGVVGARRGRGGK